MSDTRATIVATAIAVLIFLFARIKFVSALAFGSVIFCAISAPMLNALFSLANVSGVGQFFGRNQDIGYRLGAGTGRPIVWDAVFRELGSFKVDHVLGYGLYGDTKSGVSSSYAWIFYGLNGYPTYHNTALQFILDSGYVTFGIFLMILLLAVKRISESDLPQSLSKALLLSICLLCVGGATEAVFAVQKFESLCIGLAVIGVAFAVPRKQADPRFPVRMSRAAAR